MGRIKSGVTLIVNRSTVSRAPWTGLVETRKTLTADEYLAEGFVSEGLHGSNVNFETRLDEMDAVVPRADTPTDTINDVTLTQTLRSKGSK